MDRPPTVRTVALDDEGHIAEHVRCRKCDGDLLGWPPNGPCPRCGTLIDLTTDDALTRATSGAPRCAGCGQDLRLKENPERCPRCGLPVAVSLHAPASSSTADETASIAHDAYCRKCGYNLRGLRRDGLCPECATPVGVSLREDLLCFAEPGYVAKVARGSRWIAQATTVFIVCLITSILSALLLGWVGGSAAGPMWLMSTVWLVLGLLSLGATIAMLGGIWLMTTAEPGVFGPRRQDMARRLVRISLLAGLVGFTLSKSLSAVCPPLRAMAAFYIFAISFSAAGVIGIASYMRYVRGIAERIPDRDLATRARKLAQNMGIAFGVLVFFHAIDTVIQWGPVLFAPAISPAAVTPTTAPSAAMATMAAQPLRTVRSCVTGLAGLAAFVYTLRTIGLLRELRKPLEQQAGLAARTWVAAGGTGNIGP
jgi:hypothetical protein